MKKNIYIILIIFIFSCSNRIPNHIKQNEVEYLKEVNNLIDQYVDSSDEFCLRFELKSNKINDIKKSNVFIVGKVKNTNYLKRYDFKNKKIYYRELYPDFFKSIYLKFYWLNNKSEDLINNENKANLGLIDTKAAESFAYSFRINKDKLIYQISILDKTEYKQHAEAIKLLLTLITEAEFIPELYTKIKDFDDEF